MGVSIDLIVSNLALYGFTRLQTYGFRCVLKGMFMGQSSKRIHQCAYLCDALEDLLNGKARALIREFRSRINARNVGSNPASSTIIGCASIRLVFIFQEKNSGNFRLCSIGYC